MANDEPKQLKRRHHYLPIKYQEGFSREENERFFIWWFNRERKEFRREQPKNIAVKKDYYSVRNAEGKIDDQIEDTLAEMENKAWAVVRKLETKATLSFDDRMHLSHFAASLMSRTPQFDDLCKSVDEIVRMKARRGWVSEDSIEEVQPDRESVIETMMGVAQDIAPDLAAFDWSVLHAPSSMSFILTDAPFMILPPRNFPGRGYRGCGISTPGATKVVPLSSNTCLQMGEPNGRFEHRKIGDGTVRAINFHLAIRSFWNVYGKDEALIRSVVKRAHLHDRERAPRLKVT